MTNLPPAPAAMAADSLSQAEQLYHAGQPQPALLILDRLRFHAPSPALFSLMASCFAALAMEDAVTISLQHGLRLFPDDISLCNHLANAHLLAQRYGQGLQLTTAWLARNPLCPPAFYITHANLLRHNGEVQAARNILEQVLADAPDHGIALNNLGSLLLDCGDTHGAIAVLQRAIAAQPQPPGSQLHLAHAYLRSQHFIPGWQSYAARFEDRGGAIPLRPFPQPLWQGQPLGEKALLVWLEQGVGEEMLYASMLPDAKAYAPQLVVECDTRLLPLLRRSLPDIRFIGRQTPPDVALQTLPIAFQCPAGHLGHYLRPNLAAFPAHPNPWRSDPGKTAQCKAHYAALKQQRGKTGKLIGLAWRSKPMLEHDGKSTHLNAWQPIFAQSHHLFVNLQYQYDPAELPPELYTDPAINQQDSIDAFAAQINAMDAVITVSNSTAHLAGMLQQKTCVLLPRACGLIWHWFDSGDRSPWYPTLHLIRQRNDGIWDEVLQQAAAWLAGLSMES